MSSAQLLVRNCVTRLEKGRDRGSGNFGNSRIRAFYKPTYLLISRCDIMEGGLGRHHIAIRVLYQWFWKRLHGSFHHQLR